MTPPNLPKPPPKLPPKAPPGVAPKAPPPMAPKALPQLAPKAPVAGSITVTPGSPAPQPATIRANTGPAVTPIAGLAPQIAAMTEALQIYDAILIEENALLTRQDVRGVAALLDRKQKATTLYQERLRGTLANAATLEKLTPEQSGKVSRLAQTLQSHLVENAALLKGSMHALDRVFGVINEAVRKSRDQQVTYSAAGRVDGPGVTSSAIAFNANA